MTDFLQLNQQANSVNHLNRMKHLAQEQLMRNEHSVDIHRMNKRLDAEREIADDLAADVMFYKSLLSRPMAEIAKYNVDFAQAFEMQQQTMSDWILSQKAYRELALDLGFQMGIPATDVEQGYVDRVNQIANGEHPEAKMPENLTPYVKNSAEYITNSVAGKIKKIGGA